ncbi:hypothetical protein [Microbacterium rhizosphaerae]|uniref:Mannose-6-phosphate isomerase n=1 Tax=Microbacterium rhizosphaerae TaxID=1678237 RepID=A0ABZ0SNC1_9MICO|nr:hypothetical protein [Microbacterium rhizosphaerae]WPR90623.1 hypothetical protein SM116_04840 [Microbacterium rhizosphaerae]
MPSDLRPIRLPMNRPVPRPYRGGAAIERFRRVSPSGEDRAPEDRLASVVTTFGHAEEGLTLVDSVYLRELIEADPVGFLGREHVARFGANPQILCKLLHTGELQEPVDLSVILEYAPFERLAREDGLLGLDVTTALSCIDRSRFGSDRLAETVGAVPAQSGSVLFPAAARRFFRAESVVLQRGPGLRLPAQFTVLVVTEGVGTLGWADDHLPLLAGDVVLVPQGVGDVTLDGDMRAIRCMPPEGAA